MSFVYAFHLDGEAIGTIRLVPFGYQLTLTETLLATLGDAAPPTTAADWEVGRLVLAPDHRTDINLLRHCLQLTLQHFCAHAQVDYCYAACTHVLARLYRRCGFDTLAKDVLLSGTDKRYTLIRSTASHVAAGLAANASPVLTQ